MRDKKQIKKKENADESTGHAFMQSQITNWRIKHAQPLSGMRLDEHTPTTRVAKKKTMR